MLWEPYRDDMGCRSISKVVVKDYTRSKRSSSGLTMKSLKEVSLVKQAQKNVCIRHNHICEISLAVTKYGIYSLYLFNRHSKCYRSHEYPTQMP